MQTIQLSPFMSRRKSSQSNYVTAETNQDPTEYRKKPLSKYITNQSFTRLTNRYYFPDFAYHLNTDSVIYDVLSNTPHKITELLQPQTTIHLQAMEFGGIVSLNKTKDSYKVNLGANELMYKESDDSLLAHQEYFGYFMNIQNYDAAIKELEYIGRWAYKQKDGASILNYLLAQGYFHTITDQLPIAEDYYTKAHDHLVFNIDKDVFFDLNIKFRKRIEKSKDHHFNWTDLVNGLIFEDVNPIEFDLLTEISKLANITVRTKKSGSIISDLLGIKPYRRIPGRYAVREFTHRIDPSTEVLNLITGEEIAINDFLVERNTIFIQTLDFAGIISLEYDEHKKLSVTTASNDLVHGISEYSLLAHQYYFSSFMNKGNPEPALTEIQRIRSMTRNKIGKIEQFQYMLAHARALMRIRKRDKRIEALEIFEQALTSLNINFSEKEIDTLNIEIFNKIKIYENVNWNDVLITYNEIHALNLLVNTSFLLNIGSTENEFGRLLEFAITRAEYYKSYEFQFSLTMSKIDLLRIESKFIEAILVWEKLWKSPWIQGYLKSAEKEEFPAFTMYRLASLYLRIEKEEKALEILDQLKHDFIGPHVRPFQLLGLFAYYNQMNNIEKTIEVGINFYNTMQTLDWKIPSVTPLYYIRPLFTLLIQGVHTEHKVIVEQYDTMISDVFSRNENIIDSPVLQELLSLFKLEQNLKRITDDSFGVILTRYDKLIVQIENLPIYTRDKVILHYLNFILAYIDEDPKIASLIITKTDRFYELLLETVRVILPIKVHAINLILSNRKDDLNEWLDELSLHYDSKIILEIIYQVSQIDPNADLSKLKTQLLQLMDYDIIHDHHSQFEAPPLIEVLVQAPRQKSEPQDLTPYRKITDGASDLLKLLQGTSDKPSNDPSNNSNT